MKHVSKAAMIVVASSVALSGCASGTSAGNEPADGDSWPTAKNVTFVIPYSAGGPSDTAGRILSECLAADLGGTWVPENETGAAGVAAMNKITGAAPDGYTLGIVTQSTTVTAPLLVAKEAGYTYEDFDFIGQVMSYPSLFVVPKDSPYETMEDLAEAAAENPGSISVATSGAQTPFTFALQQMAGAGVGFTAVPFPGDADANVAALGGQVDAKFGGMNEQTLQYVESGDLRPLATGTDDGIPESLDGVPSLADAGLPDDLLTTDTMMAIAGPSGLPASVTDVLEPALEACVGGTAFTDVMAYQARWKTGDETRKFLADYEATLRELFAE